LKTLVWCKVVWFFNYFGLINSFLVTVLPLLKDRQLQHGLRHGDYQRYHGYCSRRLRRLREVLKIPQGDRRHFKRRDITTTEIDSDKADSRHLEIPMTMAERYDIGIHFFHPTASLC